MTDHQLGPGGRRRAGQVLLDDMRQFVGEQAAGIYEVIASSNWCPAPLWRLDCRQLVAG